MSYLLHYGYSSFIFYYKAIALASRRSLVVVGWVEDRKPSIIFPSQP
ncbi:hypothetical protein [Nostoc sp. NIES-3756]|nr:hypothetical protein [Nostoc sp. NIES-3756]